MARAGLVETTSLGPTASGTLTCCNLTTWKIVMENGVFARESPDIPTWKICLSVLLVHRFSIRLRVKSLSPPLRIPPTKGKPTLNSVFQKEKKVVSWEGGKSNKKCNAGEERQEMRLPWKPEQK